MSLSVGMGCLLSIVPRMIFKSHHLPSGFIILDYDYIKLEGHLRSDFKCMLVITKGGHIKVKGRELTLRNLLKFFDQVADRF